LSSETLFRAKSLQKHASAPYYEPSKGSPDIATCFEQSMHASIQ